MWYERCGPNTPTLRTCENIRGAQTSTCIPDKLSIACRAVVVCATLTRRQYEAVINRPGHAAYLGQRRQYAMYALYTEVIKWASKQGRCGGGRAPLTNQHPASACSGLKRAPAVGSCWAETPLLLHTVGRMPALCCPVPHCKHQLFPLPCTLKPICCPQENIPQHPLTARRACQEGEHRITIATPWLDALHPSCPTCVPLCIVIRV